METKIPTLPNWTFCIDEISAGVYKLNARHNLGCSIQLTGIDPEKLMQEGKVAAEKMEQDIERR